MFTARVSIPVDDFALAHALSVVPEMAVEADRLAACSGEWVMPCLWAAGGDFDAFDEALADDPTVAEVVVAEAVGDEKFYHVGWAEEVERHVDATLDGRGVLLHAAVDGDDWQFVIRFAAREGFEAARNYLADEEIPFRLESLTRTRAPQQFVGGLTGPQRDALVAAVEVGYFDIPREATMADVADALGVSTQAASERIRRAVERFVRTTLMTADESDLSSLS